VGEFYQIQTSATLPPGKGPGTHFTGDWVGPSGGLDRCVKSRPSPGFTSSDPPARSESLYRICYLGPLTNTLRTIKRRKANWIGHIFRRNYLLKQFIEGKLEGRMELTRRRGRRRKQLLYDLKETKGYWKLKQEAPDRAVWWTLFGRGYGQALSLRGAWSVDELWNGWLRNWNLFSVWGKALHF